MTSSAGRVLPVLAAALFAGLAPLAGSPAPSRAPDPADSPVVVLDRFQVSSTRDAGYGSAETTAGTRAAMRLEDIPGSVSILNAQLLSDLGVTDPDQALRYASAGVTSNEHTRDDITIRGFRQAMPFRDGVQSSAFVVAQLYDIERIEVIKGPVAMVFGNSGVLGGVVNYVARKPTAQPRRDLSVTLGAEGGYRRSTLNLSGPLAVARGAVRYRLTVGEQRDGLTKPVERNNQLFLGGAVDLDLGRATLSLYGFRAALDRYVIFNDFLDTTVRGVMRLNPRSTREFSPAGPDQDLHFDSTEDYLTATLVAPLGDAVAVKAFYRFRREVEPRRIIRGITVAPDNVTLNRQLLNFHFAEWSEVGQVDLLGTIRTGPVSHEWSVGADRSDVVTRERLAITPISPLNTAAPNFSADAALPVERPANNTNARIEAVASSVYVQDHLRALDGRLGLVAGVRWIRPEQTTRNFLAGATTVAPVRTQGVHRVGATYRVSPAFTVYAMDGATFLVNQGLNHLGQPLKDSAGRIREAGVKSREWSRGRWSGSFAAAWFDLEQTNVRTTGGVVVVNGNAVTEVLQNASDTSRGVEFEANGTVRTAHGDWEFLANLYRARSLAATGRRSLRTPEWSAGALAKFTFRSGVLRGLSLGAGGTFEGDKFATADGSLRHDFADLYDVFLAYGRGSGWSVRLNVENVTDARCVHSYLSPGLVGTNEPRKTRVTVRYAW